MRKYFNLTSVNIFSISANSVGYPCIPVHQIVSEITNLLLNKVVKTTWIRWKNVVMRIKFPSILSRMQFVIVFIIIILEFVSWYTNWSSYCSFFLLLHKLLSNSSEVNFYFIRVVLFILYSKSFSGRRLLLDSN